MRKTSKGIFKSAIFMSVFVLFFAIGGKVFAQVCEGLPKGFIDYAACTAEKSRSCFCNISNSLEIKTCERVSSCPSDRPNRCIGSLYGSCPIPTPIVSCQGQYYGKPQCDARGSVTYGKGGTCQLNPALGTINPSNPNDPINYWKWSYCKSTLVPTVVPTMTPTPIPTVTPIPTPTVVPTSCQGQYYGKPQCDARGSISYGKGGTCQLNPALGTINPSNPNDPINYWKWSYCK